MLGSANVKKAGSDVRRSGCPVSISLEMLGDRWSLLIVRDLMVRGYRTFREFLMSGEGIATNILADRLTRLQESGVVDAEADSTDGRKVNYRLTEKGIDLAPALFDLLLWGAKYEQSAAPCALLAEMAANRESVLAEVRRRWRERDSRPLLPCFGGAASGPESGNGSRVGIRNGPSGAPGRKAPPAGSKRRKGEKQ